MLSDVQLQRFVVAGCLLRPTLIGRLDLSRILPAPRQLLEENKEAIAKNAKEATGLAVTAGTAFGKFYHLVNSLLIQPLGILASFLVEGVIAAFFVFERTLQRVTRSMAGVFTALGMNGVGTFLKSQADEMLGTIEAAEEMVDNVRASIEESAGIVSEFFKNARKERDKMRSEDDAFFAEVNRRLKGGILPTITVTAKAPKSDAEVAADQKERHDAQKAELESRRAAQKEEIALIKQASAFQQTENAALERMKALELEIRNELKNQNIDLARRTELLQMQEDLGQLRRQREKDELELIKKGIQFRETDMKMRVRLQTLEAAVSKELKDQTISLARQIELLQILVELKGIGSENQFFPQIGVTPGGESKPVPNAGLGLDRAAVKAAFNDASRLPEKHSWGPMDALGDLQDLFTGGFPDAVTNGIQAVDAEFQALFENLFRDMNLMNDGLRNLGKGLAKAVTSEMAGMARTKVKVEIAASISAAAEALGALGHGNFPGAATFGLEAAKHLAAAAAWGVVAGGVGALSPGGGSSGVNSQAGTFQNIGGKEAERANQGPQTIINLYIDGVDPRNPRHQELVGATMRQFTERNGSDIRINGRRA